MAFFPKGKIRVLTILLGCVISGGRGDGNQKRSVSPGQGFILGDDKCQRKITGTCQPLQNKTCFGVEMPYNMTSAYLVNENFTQHQLLAEMMRWEGLRHAPKCWSFLLPLLCSYYFPKCQDNPQEQEAVIYLPPQEFCKAARAKCSVVEEATKLWPAFLQCNDTGIFLPSQSTSGCGVNFGNITKSSPGKCVDEMKEVESEFSYYKGFEGCALKCQDPFYNEEDHASVSKLVWYMGLASLIGNGGVVLTYIVDGWSSSQYPQYPSAVVLYANVWYLIATVGWLFQYLPLGKEDIVCRKDGTVRRDEPTMTENIFCAMVSTWIYGSIMSVLAWLMVFAYVWHLTCNAVGRMRQTVDKQRPYFIVWTLIFPIALSVICFSVGKIDGSSMYGVCFVGFHDVMPRIFLVIVPIALTSFLTIFYLIRGAHRLLSVSLSSSDFIDPKGRAELKSNAFRVILFCVLAGLLLTFGLILQLKSMFGQPLFEKSLRESFLCRLNLMDMAECGVTNKHKPNVWIIMGNVIVFFGGGLLVASWAWTSQSLRIWKRSIRKICSSTEEEEHQVHMKKHKLISKAYEKRHELHAKGRLSLSQYSTHEDPIGLNKLLDPNHLCRNIDDMDQSQQYSQATGDGQEISSEWAAALPAFVNRRGALVPPHSSNSVSCVSEDSRRPSYDSALSEQYAKHLQGSNLELDRKSSRRKERFRMSRHRPGKFFKSWRRSSNRGSSTSLESNPGSQILPAITKLIEKRDQMDDDNQFVPNNQATRTQYPQTKVLRELAIQTSIEQLYYPPKGVKQCNLSNNLCADKSTSTSNLVSFSELGTQTKKSALKKGDKLREKKEGEEGVRDKELSQATQTLTKDPVLELLTPKTN